MSPTPTSSRVIAIKITDGGANTTFDGARVVARNRSNSNEKIDGTVSSGKIVLDLANFDTAPQDGDIIEFNITGNTYGTGTITVGKSAKSLTITTADQSSTGVGISL